MARNDQDEFEYAEPHPRAPSAPREAPLDDASGAEDAADVTVILPDEADFEPEGDLTEDMGDGAGMSDAAPDAMATEALTGDPMDIAGEETEDVFVLLPDSGEEIPVVATEEITVEEDAEGVGLVSEVNSPDDAYDPNSEDTELTMSGGEEGDSPALDELTSELDDELLTQEYDDLEVYDPDAVMNSEDEYGEQLEEGESDLVDHRSAAVGGGKKIALLAAAVVIVGVVGFLGYSLSRSPGDGSATTIASAAGSDGSVAVPGDGSDGAISTAVVEAPGPGDGEAQVETGVDLLAASRQTFNDKFLLVMELGFAGEVGNE